MLFFPSLLQLFYQPHPPPPCPTLFAFPSVFSLCLSILGVSLSQRLWCRAPTNTGTEGIRIKDHCSRRMRRIPSVSSVTIWRTDALRNVFLDGDRSMIPRTFSGHWALMSELKTLAFCPNVINISCPSEQSQSTLKSHIHLLEHGWEFLSLYNAQLSTVFWD